MQTRRAFLERYTAAWAQRAAARRRSGTATDLLIADVLDRTVAGMLDELVACPPDPAPPGTRKDEVSWSSPVFNAGGCFDPFAGTKRERMLASAAVCERLGAAEAAGIYRGLAETTSGKGGSAANDRRSLPAQTGKVPQTGSWTGPAMPPPEVAAFVAGPQLGLFA